jgi:hypothetical protein
VLALPSQKANEAEKEFKSYTYRGRTVEVYGMNGYVLAKKVAQRSYRKFHS